MKMSQLNSSIFLLLLTLSFSVSLASLSSILDVPLASSQDIVDCILSKSENVTFTSQLIFTRANASFLPIWEVRIMDTRFLKPSTPKPSVIVTPVEETLVQTTLLCAKEHGYELRMRSGGHDFEGISYSANVPFVMIDFINMGAVDVDVESSTAWVQAGAALGAVYYAISQKTDTLYFPAGLCPTVNIGGYLGGAGYGNLLRKYGTGGDHVVDVHFIDVNGNILDRQSMGEDLFWAIRGGGVSSFGIGTIDTLLPLMDEKFPELGVTVNICEEMTSVQSSLVSWGLPSSTPPEILTNRSAFAKVSSKVKSDYVRAPIPISGIRQIWRKLLRNDNSALVVTNAFGGRMAEYSETEIPYPHRAGVLFQVYKAVFFTDQASDTTPVSLRRRAWLQSFDQLLTPYVSSNPREAFINYNDVDLGVANANFEEASAWGDRYWKRENFEKLVRIKAEVDPENFFRHPQSIPLLEVTSRTNYTHNFIENATKRIWHNFVEDVTEPIQYTAQLIHERGVVQTHPNIKMSQLNSFVFHLILTLSISVSLGSLSSILDVTQGSSQDIVDCILSKSDNVTFTSQLIFTPSNTSFLPIWEVRIMDTRMLKPSTHKPSVIVTPLEETLVQTTLLCAKELGYELRMRSGGHDFEGISYSANAPFVMIDFINMGDIDVDVANRTAWVQTGAALGAVYYAISQKSDTLYFPAGLCPTVNIGGYLGGAGYGNLLRKYGTGGDHVVDVRFIDASGNILDRESMGEDLFWAIRGGGVSSFGIVLAWKIGLVAVPEKVTYFSLNKTLEDGVTEIFYKYQTVAPAIDENLLIRTSISPIYIGNTTRKTVNILFEGFYQGTIDTLLPLMDEKFPELGVTVNICEEMTSVQSSLVSWGLPSSTPPEILTNRSAFAKVSSKVKSDYVRAPIPISGIRQIWRKLLRNDNSALVVTNAFGGRMAEYSETEIPYPHRVGVLFQVYKAVFFTDQTSDTTPVSLRRRAWLLSFDQLLTPYVSSNPREAFINYNDVDLGVANGNFEEASAWGDRYWKRENFEKLVRIKAEVDPENFFRHPQSIPVFSTSLSDV
ncbi:hypothetical protein LXL04_001979 [Taraxacum kok-saghyz]